MKIRVLGSHGSDLLLKTPSGLKICRSVGFLVNNELMVDAGTLASGLTLNEQQQVKHILLSHLHLDHVKGIPPLVDNLSGLIDHQIVVTGLSSVVEGLQKYVFNNMVFPDFFHLQGPRHSILRAQGLEAKEEKMLGAGISIMPVVVNHTVETAGFLIRDESGAWIYSGDTHITDEIWQVAARTPDLKGIFIEVSFPDSMMDIAIQSKHLTPTLLAKEFRKIGKPHLPLFVYHMKPTVRETIIEEIAKLGIEQVTVLEEGQEIVL